MKNIQISNIVVVASFFALIFTGCATNRESVKNDNFLLHTNVAPGETYDVRIYVVERGDTIAKIARKFQITIADFEAANPNLNPLKLKIGQEVRIYERLAN